MSHFVLLVAGVAPENLEEALAPFDENTEDPRYCVFVSSEAEYRQKYASEGCEMVRLPSGELAYTWDLRFQTCPLRSKEPKFPAGSEVITIPHNQRYPTFDEFIRDWAGLTEQDPVTQEYGCYRNPQGKWDWYEIGGRWDGYFQLKEKAPYPAVGASLNQLLNLAKGLAAEANVTTRGAWDLEGQRQAAAQRAGERYDKFFRLLDGRPLSKPWQVVCAEYEDRAAAQKAYQEQETVQFIRENIRDFSEFGFGDLCLEFAVPREEYQALAARRTGIPFAILKDGKWYEKGSMGWWGSVSNEVSEEDWETQASALLDSLPEDTQLIAVDCHS